MQKDQCFIKAFYDDTGYEHLEKWLQGDKKKMERYVNAWSLLDLFCLWHYKGPKDDDILEAFAGILKRSWEVYFSTLKKDTHFVVEVGMEIEGENGLSITVYQDRDSNA